MVRLAYNKWFFVRIGDLSHHQYPDEVQVDDFRRHRSWVGIPNPCLVYKQRGADILLWTANELMIFLIEMKTHPVTLGGRFGFFCLLWTVVDMRLSIGAGCKFMEQFDSFV